MKSTLAMEKGDSDGRAGGWTANMRPSWFKTTPNKVQLIVQSGAQPVKLLYPGQPAPPNIDWICVSPKIKASDLVIKSGNELKFVYPQETIQPEQFENFEFDLFYLVPMDGENKQRNTQLTLEYCLKNPKWKLNLQIQKLIGLQ